VTDGLLCTKRQYWKGPCPNHHKGTHPLRTGFQTTNKDTRYQEQDTYEMQSTPPQHIVQSVKRLQGIKVAGVFLIPGGNNVGVFL